MAGKTRNTVLIQARKRADELATKRREREENLKVLATEYLVETMTADQLVEDAERAAAELIQDAKAAAAAARERAKLTVAKMLSTGETRNGVAELLDVSLSYVRGIDVATSKAATPPAAVAATPDLPADHESPATAAGGVESEQGGGVGVVA